MNTRWKHITAATLIIAAGALATWTGFAQGRAQDAQSQQTGRSGFDFQMLVGGLNSTPGCLGVEVAQFQSGKLSIFAWFENKAAALRWYNHPIHRGASGAFFPNGTGTGDDFVPMAHITDEDSPIMVIATLTPNREAQAGGPPLSQISIELYQPLQGGLAVGGRLTPREVAIQHMTTIDSF